MSPEVHVELAIGESAAAGGVLSNVLRIYVRAYPQATRLSPCKIIQACIYNQACTPLAHTNPDALLCSAERRTRRVGPAHRPKPKLQILPNQVQRLASGQDHAICTRSVRKAVFRTWHDPKHCVSQSQSLQPRKLVLRRVGRVCSQRRRITVSPTRCASQHLHATNHAHARPQGTRVKSGKRDAERSRSRIFKLLSRHRQPVRPPHIGETARLQVQDTAQGRRRERTAPHSRPSCDCAESVVFNGYQYKTHKKTDFF